LTGWLLDANILSELRRPRPERKVLAFIAAQTSLCIAVTFAEIRFGIELLADAGRRAELNDWLAHKVRPMFEQRVLAITEDIIKGGSWSRMAARRPIPSLTPISSLPPRRCITD
jgi:predicted nucleic acid-binding protein